MPGRPTKPDLRFGFAEEKLDGWDEVALRLMIGLLVVLAATTALGVGLAYGLGWFPRA